MFSVVNRAIEGSFCLLLSLLLLSRDLEIPVRNKKSRTPKQEIFLKNNQFRTLNVEVIYPSVDVVGCLLMLPLLVGCLLFLVFIKLKILC